ncbi:acyltransferase [Vibrio genomosp. F10]|uniref:acyltransferase n=1 Tax=Vibrio genomosp. F10 TaxID=723171 RepID=UPI0003648EF1|nr:acyltransferase [Vibrio genomosp. F10]OEF04576.1 transferase [Vibrio genomosp. F10 str. 9ZB36]
MKRVFRLLFHFYVALFSSLPTIIGAKLRYLAYKPLFKETSGFFYIDTGVSISGFNNIKLGKNVAFMKNSYVYAHDDGKLTIGDNFTMNSNSQLGAAFGRIVIGNDCAIGPNCVLRASNHNFDSVDTTIREQGHSFGEIIIEDDVWIASNCVVTANTTIAKSSIVAAGSVITKDVGAYSIVGGVPAKLLRKRKR